MEEQNQQDYPLESERSAVDNGHLDTALQPNQLLDFEEEIELYRTYGGD